MKDISELSRLCAFALAISLGVTMLTSCEKHREGPRPLAPGEREQIAKQIPGRDLSENPPRTGDVGLTRMSKPTDEVNAVVTVKYEEPNLPPTLKIILDEKVVTLHDDGKGSDQKAGDGVYTAEVMADLDAIEQNNVRIEKLIKGNDRANLIPVFENRAIVFASAYTVSAVQRKWDSKNPPHSSRRLPGCE